MDRKEWTPKELYRHLRAGEPLFVLDLRSREDFERWRIDAPRPMPAVNVPYFELLGDADEDRLVDAAARYAQQELAGRLPREATVVAVCGQGHTSALVAEGLRRLGYDAVNLAGGMEAWGNHYEFVPLREDDELALVQVTRPARGCLSYVLASRGEAVVVDPLRHVDRYEEFLRERGLRLVAVVDTHAHADHVSGAAELARRMGVPYYLHPYDAIHPIDMLPAAVPYEPLRGGQAIRFGSAALEVLHIPGHTLGNTALRVGGQYLLTGDSIFIESVARPDLGGRGEAWSPLHYRSLRRLAGLPESTWILPGHFSSLAEADAGGCFVRSLGELKRANEALRKLADGEETFVRYLLDNLPEFPPQYVDIKRVNAGLLDADERMASELELGKNLCALAQAYAGR